MNIIISRDEMDTFVYDSRNGVGAAAGVVDAIRAGQGVRFKSIFTTTEMEAAADDAKNPDSESEDMSAFSYK
jgi:hypothetical protein